MVTLQSGLPQHKDNGISLRVEPAGNTPNYEPKNAEILAGRREAVFPPFWEVVGAVGACRATVPRIQDFIHFKSRINTTASMASTSSFREKRLVSSLNVNVLAELSNLLNPKLFKKDYRWLAGSFGYKDMQVKQFESKEDPTLEFLRDWWTSKYKEKTVSLLIEHLKRMERDDAIDILRPYEYESDDGRNSPLSYTQDDASKNHPSKHDDPNKKNATKLLRLLLDRGTVAQRNVFDIFHPPEILKKSLLSYKDHLLSLRSVSSQDQDIMFPSDDEEVSSVNFDFNLLQVLITNICRLHPPASTQSWKENPHPSDQSMEANLARIYHYTELVLSRYDNTGFTDRESRSLWNDISDAIKEISPETDAEGIPNLKRMSSVETDQYVSKNVQEWQTEQERLTTALHKYAEYWNVLEGQEKTRKRKLGIGDLKSQSDENQCASKQPNSSRKQLQDPTEVKREGEKLEDVPKRLTVLEKKVQDYQRKVTQAVKNQGKHLQKQHKNLKDLIRFDFKGDIDILVKSFQKGTRKWLFKHFFGSEKPLARITVLTAHPGFGKSVFSARICQILAARKQLAACHFCKFNFGDYRNPQYMLQSLALHFCQNVDGFEEKLIEHLKRPHSMDTIADSFRVLLKDPLHELNRRNLMILVIDGVDEVDGDTKNEFLDLIFEEFLTLPRWIHLLMTSRPELLLQEKLEHVKAGSREVEHLEINQDNKNNMNDIKCYLREYSAGSLDARILDHLAEESKGSFLYAFFILQDVLKNKSDYPTFVSIKRFLPKGIGAMYNKYFKRLEEEVGRVAPDVDFSPILDVLVAAQAPVPLSFFPEVLYLSTNTSAMKKLIKKLKEILSGHLVFENNCVTFFHEAVCDWLMSSEEHTYVVNSKSGHEHLARVCEKQLLGLSSGSGIQLTKLPEGIKYAFIYGEKHKLLSD